MTVITKDMIRMVNERCAELQQELRQLNSATYTASHSSGRVRVARSEKRRDRGLCLLLQVALRPGLQVDDEAYRALLRLVMPQVH